MINSLKKRILELEKEIKEIESHRYIFLNYNEKDIRKLKFYATVNYYNYKQMKTELRILKEQLKSEQEILEWLNKLYDGDLTINDLKKKIEK